MKILIALILLFSFASCGKNRSGGESKKDRRTSFLSNRKVSVATPFEAHKILRVSARRGKAYKFHNVKWYLHNGTYLFTTEALNDYQIIFR